MIKQVSYRGRGGTPRSLNFSFFRLAQLKKRFLLQKERDYLQAKHAIERIKMAI